MIDSSNFTMLLMSTVQSRFSYNMFSPVVYLLIGELVVYLDGQILKIAREI